MSEQHTGADSHVFGLRRPSQRGHFPVSLTSDAEQRDTKFRPLPDPESWRQPPYHLDLATVLSAEAMDTIRGNRRLTFHLNGDMGGINEAMPQELVAKGMEMSFDPDADASVNPSFLYITGDCVYFNGEIEQYGPQFYAPYKFYPQPIFAVAGNHDGENIVDKGESLDGFMRNFCAQEAVVMPEARDSQRTAMTQPYVHWTLTTPLCNIVGLYSNVPEHGEIKQPQLDWYVNELRTLPRDVPLMVALHHPPFSADDHHGGSDHMLALLDQAAQTAGRAPEMVLAGHVHNYQRLSRSDANGGNVTPFIVSGAGGYHNLHHVQQVNHQPMVPPVVLRRIDGKIVTLHSYTDNQYGFLMMSVTPDLIIGDYYEVAAAHAMMSPGNKLVDHWEFDWKARTWLTNDLSGRGSTSHDPDQPLPLSPHGHVHRPGSRDA